MYKNFGMNEVVLFVINENIPLEIDSGVKPLLLSWNIN